MAAPFEGIIGGTNYYWGLEDSHPSAKRFNDAYRKKHGDAVPSQSLSSPSLHTSGT